MAAGFASTAAVSGAVAWCRHVLPLLLPTGDAAAAKLDPRRPKNGKGRAKAATELTRRHAAKTTFMVLENLEAANLDAALFLLE